MPRKAPDGPQDASKNLEKSKPKHGGPRPNSGRKVGSKLPSTVTKEQIREAIRQQVAVHVTEMTAAQIANTKGLKYLVARDPKTGKFERIGADSIEGAYLAGKVIEVWEKDPSIQAYTDLINRAADKPKEQEQELKITGEADLIQALYHGRAKAKAQKD